MMRPPDFPDVPFTVADVYRLGMDRRRIDAAVRSRQIRRVLQGVYVRADLPDSIELRVAAAARVLSPFAVICDRTAAWIYGVDVLEHHELDVLPPLESYTWRGHARTARRECQGGQRDLKPEDVCLIDGVAVTTPLRTCMDLGCKLSRRRAVAAMDALMRVCGVTVEEMRAVLPRYFRRRGVVQLRELVQLVDPRSESPGESWTRLEVVAAGLPAPQPQYWVCVGGVPVYRLDLAWPRAKVALEYDGREFHEGDAAVRADEQRRAWLRQQGWTVIVVDKDSFTPEAITGWMAELKAALGLTDRV